MTLTDEMKRKAMEVGFVAVGVASPDRLRGLPHGWIGTVVNLRAPEEELPSVESVMLLGYYAWDKAFNLQVDSTHFQDRANYVPEVPSENYQLYYEVLRNKAWMIVGPRLRLIAILTAAELDVDEPFEDDLCGECERCIAACPTKALKPYKIQINRCMTYAAEEPEAPDVPADVRSLEKRLIQRPTVHSYVECTTCIEACPIGKPRRTERRFPAER